MEMKRAYEALYRGRASGVIGVIVWLQTYVHAGTSCGCMKSSACTCIIICCMEMKKVLLSIPTSVTLDKGLSVGFGHLGSSVAVDLVF